MNNLEVIVCGRLDKTRPVRLIDDLFKSLSNCDFNIHLVNERRFREESLNEGIRFVKDRDVLILGDDIILTDGWFEELVKHRDKGDIIGFSTLYPDSDIIENTGYDLVKVDERIVLEARNRGKKLEEVECFDYSYCDSICGCTMFIDKRVLRKISHFSLDGQNRWGEFIFTQQAKKLGFRVIVLGHFLFHSGDSTKQNEKLRYSSISYHIEKNIWQHICEKYVDEKAIKYVYKSVLSDNFIELLKSDGKLLIYGIGSIAELIAKVSNLKRIDFCTGLREEVGLKFFGKETLWFEDVDFSLYRGIIISTLNRPDQIYKKIVEKLAIKWLLRQNLLLRQK